MSEKTQNIELSVKDNLIRLLIIGFIVFLFILFFQPFPLEMLEYNDRLLYVTGFGIMTFIIASIFYVILPRFFSRFSDFSDWDTSPSLILSLIFFVLNATSYSFYIRYVGLTTLSIYIIFKIVLVSLIPVALMILQIKFRSQQKMIDNFQFRLWNNLTLKFKLENLLDSEFRQNYMLDGVEYIYRTYKPGRRFGVSLTYSID